VYVVMVAPECAPAANFFGRDRLYGYWDDAERFAFFSKAAVEFIFRANKRPDIVHCHDWQTGLVPVLLHEQYARVMPGQKTCYTIHNFRHQGTSDERVLWATQLGRPDHFLSKSTSTNSAESLTLAIHAGP
jgi:starch synthase